MNPAPRIITFYSYKGGVGRSMALLNVAYTLQSLGRHVLVIDLDLEAPGVSGFLTRNQELEPHPADQPDVVDFLKAALPVARWRPGSTDRPIIPKLSDYLRSVKPDCFAPAQNPRFERTRIDVITASDAQDYANRLADLNVAGFSSEDLEELGNVVRDLIGRHEFPFTRLKDEPPVPTKYDYVLVDSRTGFTETSGLCIGPLSDRLVVFTGLNDQNINGTAEFLRVVGLKAAARSEPWDDQDDIKDTTRYAARIGPKPTFLVASPVPHGDMELKKSRFQAIKDTIGTAPNFFITYHPRLSLFETIFLRDFPEEGITSEYRELTNAILRMVMDDASHLRSLVFPSAQLTTISHLGEPVPGFNSSSREPETEPTIDIILRLAALIGEEDVRQMADRFNFNGIRLSQQALSAQDPKVAAPLYQDSFKAFSHAILLNPSNQELLANWGVALYNQANSPGCDDREGNLRRTLEKFETALAVSGDSPAIIYNQGLAFHALAKLKEGGEADALLRQAEQCFVTAINLKCRFSDAFNNLGNVLVDRGKLASGTDSDNFFAQAFSAYQNAVRIEPESSSAWNSWGATLANYAKAKTGRVAEGLLADAVKKLETALSLKPDHHVAIHNLGIALSRQARLKTGSEADALFAAAEEKYRAALAIKPDAVDVRYNLGCLQGMRGDAVGAVAWLRKAAEGGYEVTRAKLAEDRDFERVRDAAEFREFVAGLSR